MKRIVDRIILWAVVLLVGGCAHLEPETEQLITEYPTPDKIGIYHKVNRGETLWRIAKTYDVPIRDIIKSNNIPNMAQIEENQLIFIPEATAVKQIILESEEDQKDFIWPVEGKIINYFHHYKGDKLNQGIDIEATAGKTVRAARTGRVVFADFLSGYGYMVILDHLDGFHTVYAQNSKLLVDVGDYVFKNNPIAQIGANSKLAYLHFQIRKNSVEDNPLFYLP